MSYFDRIVEIAELFNTPYIRIFNFLKPLFGLKSEDKWREMIDLMKPYAEKAEKKKVVLLLENESVAFSDTIANTIDKMNTTHTHVGTVHWPLLLVACVSKKIKDRIKPIILRINNQNHIFVNGFIASI